ncbi:MAG: BREX system P-loop protein BrxC [Polyangiaceae bacterium]|nr:BREX system P-loop protein BrxC [Polyangiaceae bacterium]
MLIHDLFERDVTRAIPPVVYFHEQQPEELEREVSEYIVTGGYKKDDTRATDDGIHEELLRLLTGMRAELAGWASGHRLPACWISGFYGSGKSSLAKLLGLALDGRKLPGGRPLAEALLARDTSPKGDDLRRAWAELVGALKAAPLAVVFDVGSKARDDEHVHAVIVRMTQERLGYATLSQLVAEYELKLENEGLYGAFIDKVAEVHARPWSELQKSQLVEDYFSAVMHALKPELYPEPTSFVDARSGTEVGLKRSADDAVRTIAEMMKHRAPGRALFIVIDEVSQYVHDDNNRMLALQSFVSALGQRMNGEAWLLATGQQKLEDGAGATAIVKLKDRFPPGLRVHLGPANIRDVVHKRLLKKQRPAESVLRELFEEHRADLRNYGYKPDSFSVDDFVEVYPLLPGYVELLLGITTGLRTRSTRVQGDSHAIRGLLQLLGDLFRHDHEKLTRMEVGRLITIDLVFDILASALDADLQMTLAAAFDFCGKRGEDRALLERVLKAVAMLEHVQDKEKTTPELIARCLYARLGEGDLTPAVEKALDVLRGELPSVLGADRLPRRELGRAGVAARARGLRRHGRAALAAPAGGARHPARGRGPAEARRHFVALARPVQRRPLRAGGPHQGRAQAHRRHDRLPGRPARRGDAVGLTQRQRQLSRSHRVGHRRGRCAAPRRQRGRALGAHGGPVRAEAGAALQRQGALPGRGAQQARRSQARAVRRAPGRLHGGHPLLPRPLERAAPASPDLQGGPRSVRAGRAPRAVPPPDDGGRPRERHPLPDREQRARRAPAGPRPGPARHPLLGRGQVRGDLQRTRAVGAAVVHQAARRRAGLDAARPFRRAAPRRAAGRGASLCGGPAARRQAARRPARHRRAHQRAGRRRARAAEGRGPQEGEPHGQRGRDHQAGGSERHLCPVQGPFPQGRPAGQRRDRRRGGGALRGGARAPERDRRALPQAAGRRGVPEGPREARLGARALPAGSQGRANREGDQTRPLRSARRPLPLEPDGDRPLRRDDRAAV